MFNLCLVSISTKRKHKIINIKNANFRFQILNSNRNTKTSHFSIPLSCVLHSCVLHVKRWMIEWMLLLLSVRYSELMNEFQMNDIGLTEYQSHQKVPFHHLNYYYYYCYWLSNDMLVCMNYSTNETFDPFSKFIEMKL